MRSTRRSIRLAALVLPALILASAGCDIAMADFKEKQSAQWKKTYELQPGGRFELSNINGKIDVEPSTGNTIEVIADKTAKAASIDAAKQALERIEIVESATPGSIRIETKVQRSNGMFGGAGAEVRYTVRVPAGTDMKLSTVNGGIELTGLSGRLDLEVTNGGIKATNVSGQVDASATNGGVDVDVATVSENGIKLGTVNGGVKLRLPADAKASISARVTNGGIDTSGLKLENTGEATRRRLDATLNGGIQIYGR
jgi:hypothetical protein